MKHAFRNWKTTLAGVAMVLTGIATAAKGDIPTGVTTVIAGFGLIAAKDADKSGLAE